MSIDSQELQNILFPPERHGELPDWIQNSLSGISDPQQAALDTGDRATALDVAARDLGSTIPSTNIGQTLSNISARTGLDLNDPTTIGEVLDRVDPPPSLFSRALNPTDRVHGPVNIPSVIGELLNPDVQKPETIRERVEQHIEQVTDSKEGEDSGTEAQSTVYEGDPGQFGSAGVGFGGAGQSSAGTSADTGTESPAGGGQDRGGMDSDMGASSYDGGGYGYLNTGGRVGALIQHLQTGGDVGNADTNMEVANVPMGVVDDPDGAPGPFSGGTGVEDDLDMDVEAGSYVLNAEAVQLIGISDINEVIRDAFAIAIALGKNIPSDYDPENKVPIRISNGEAVIPKSLVEIIGLDKLEKWNQKGLALRQQKEKLIAERQQQQPPQEQQVASEAPVQQQMGQLMNEGGKTGYGQVQVGEISQGINLDAFTTRTPQQKPENITEEQAEESSRLLSGVVERPDELLISKRITQPEIKYILTKHYGSKLPTDFKKAIDKEEVPRNLRELARVITKAEWRNTKELEKGDTFRFTLQDKPDGKGKFSSAFGPGQITYTRAEDILELIPDRDKNFKEYVKKYITQGKQRINLLQENKSFLASSTKKEEQGKRKPFRKRDKRLFAKGIGKIPLAEHKKYYNRLFNLHLEDHLNTYRKNK
jgi:hypothetical protein